MNVEAMDLLEEARQTNSLRRLEEIWERANAMVGQRAPAEQAEFLLYGFCEGKREGLMEAAGIIRRGRD